MSGLLHIPPTIPATTPRLGQAPGVPALDPREPGFSECRIITRARARNFYLGLRLAPEPRRSALLALYTWMRHADDLADAEGLQDSPTTRLASLGDYRARTVEALAGARGGDLAEASPGRAPATCERWWPAFLRTARVFDLSPETFTLTLDALDDDAGGVDHESALDLARYCDRVAGTVGLSCLGIWGVRREQLAPRAIHLAILRARAVQLTNILRDLREDLGFAPRRSYLPRESFASHGVTPESLLARPDAPGAVALMGEWIAQTRALYKASRELESLIDPSCARVCWALGAIYESLLHSIERRPSTLVRHRISVPRARKISIAVAGWLGVGLPG